ncbi:hypothetical protein DDZ13_08480 [Coraliomargarita sinensis]|uniref:Outer membrane lipoprotein-sorting protein n=1 Tax=Coraliomargarita sinensis TaxID=2174842 RepID=A0A317ZF55_9BACT|nr:hypothetical protein [Coraliomargarita sinensis]PXA04066.1 hypothetical protein DDZ13_08480 [Coraliomargarita sinensis]
MTQYLRISFLLFVLLFSLCVSAEVEEDSSLPGNRELYEAYLEACGGRANIAKIQSLLLSGEIETSDGTKSSIKMFKRRPNRMRLLLERGNYKIETIFDGEQGAHCITIPGREPRWVPIKGDERQTLITDSRLDAPFYYIGRNPENFAVKGIQEIDGREAYELLIYDSDYQFKRMWLDAEHYQEVMFMNQVKAGSGVVTETTKVSDFTSVNGVLIPQKLQSYQGDKLIQTLTFDSIQCNAGIFESYFEVPDDIKE